MVTNERINMEYRLIGGSDLKVSVLSLGTATFGGGDEFFNRGLGGHLGGQVLH